jgi:hypothetical protein
MTGAIAYGGVLRSSLSVTLVALSACGPTTRVERYTVGDTAVVQTHLPARMDTARLEIAARYSVPRTQGDTGVHRIEALALGDDGGVYIATTHGGLQRLGHDGKFQSWQPANDAGAAPLLARLRAPQPADTLSASPSLVGACRQKPDEHFRSGGFADIRQRYLPTVQQALLPAGGKVIGCNADYTFHIVDTGGRVTRVRHERTLVPVSDEERRSFVLAWTLRMRNADGGPNWSWQGDPLPAWKPAYQRILTSSDGRIWIWPAQPSQSVPAPPQWVLIGGPKKLWVEPGHGAFDVFATDGTFIGSVALAGELGYSPFSVTPVPVVRADTIWLVVADSTGSHTLVRAHVRWPRLRFLRARARSASRVSAAQAHS